MRAPHRHRSNELEHAGVRMRVVRPDVREPGTCLVLVHGYGATADHCGVDVERFVSQTGAAVIVPEGNDAACWSSGRAWFPLSVLPERNRQGAAHASRRLQSALDECLSRYGWLGRVELGIAGFSQGAMVAIDLALTWSRRLAFTASFAGALDPLHGERATHPRRFILALGDADRYVTIDAVEQCGRALRDLGHLVRVCVIPHTHHAIGPRVVAHLKRLVNPVSPTGRDNVQRSTRP